MTTTFAFEACIGRGGFGEVYIATMTSPSGLRRTVAIKTLNATAAPNTDAVRRLRDEARLLAALHHRAILQVHDLVTLRERHALVTEYVEGQDLSALLAEPPPRRVGVEIIGEVAGALHAAYTTPAPDTGLPMHLVHRDIKPSNIRIARSGGVKLLDFGIAVSPSVRREARTSTGLIIGTAGYIAPERFTEEELLPASDVYALGCVLYELLGGGQLYRDVTRRQLTSMSVREEEHAAFVAAAVARLRDVQRPVAELLERVLAFDPQRRPDAEALEAACDELAGELEGPHLRRWARDRDWPESPAVSGEWTGLSLKATAVEAAPGDTVDLAQGDETLMFDGLTPDAPTPGSPTLGGEPLDDARFPVETHLTSPDLLPAAPQPVAGSISAGSISAGSISADTRPPRATASMLRRGAAAMIDLALFALFLGMPTGIFGLGGEAPFLAKVQSEQIALIAGQPGMEVPPEVTFDSISVFEDGWTLSDKDGPVLSRTEGQVLVRDAEGEVRPAIDGEHSILFTLSAPARRSVLLVLGLWVIYSAAALALIGATPGKRILDLGVRSASGAVLGWGAALLRGVFQVLGLALCGVGWVWALLSSRRETWHDRIAGTRVVHLPRE